MFIADFFETGLVSKLVALPRTEARNGVRSVEEWSDAGTPASEEKTAWPQREEICSRAPPEDVAPLMLMDCCRAAEECLDSFIDIAAGSSEIDPRRSTHNSEPTLVFAMNFDRDAFRFLRTFGRTDALDSSGWLGGVGSICRLSFFYLGGTGRGTKPANVQPNLVPRLPS